jgi:glycosyltransferase involved in cell wall biosynthesis
VLVIAPLPPPITGQALAVQSLVNELSVAATSVNTSRAIARTSGHALGPLMRGLTVARLLPSVAKRVSSSDVIYFNVSQSPGGNLKDLLIFAVCWRALGRTVVHLHGGAGMRELLSERRPILRALNSFFLRRVGAVVVLGERLKSIYDGIVPPSRLHVVANFAQDEFFVDPSEIERKFSQALPLRLLFLSNLLPGKGHEELLAGIALLTHEERAGIEVDFAGAFESPEAESAFRARAAAISNACIRIHGVVQGETKRELLRRAHLFCLPTYYPYEGQPISILEAYASGCAVMTTNHSGIFDVFSPGINGIEVVPKSPESVAHAIREAARVPDPLRNCAAQNVTRARRMFTSACHLEALLNLFTRAGLRTETSPQ